MKNSPINNLDLSKVETPAYIVNSKLLEKNLKILKDVQDKSGAHILLAQKGFSMYSTYPLIAKYLSGTTSSGLNEALLAKEFFHKEIHVYSPAYTQAELNEIAKFADSIIFNSQAQIDSFAKNILEIAKNSGNSKLHIGLRVNPEYAEVETQIYNPCASGSRLGALKSSLDSDIADKISLLHFHAMCEQNSDVLERILSHFEEKFSDIIKKVKYINFGGGHHITNPNYDIDKLINLIKYFYKKYPNIEKIYLEPGEAIAINTGVFVSRVLDIHQNNGDIAILDCSATCHMPDVLEMPYRPNVYNADLENVKAHTYNLTGRSCLAGDVIGKYSFDKKLNVGDVLVFDDMSHYTMVKTTTFNGMNLPDIAIWDENKYQIVKKFNYNDFKNRL